MLRISKTSRKISANIQEQVICEWKKEIDSESPRDGYLMNNYINLKKGKMEKGGRERKRIERRGKERKRKKERQTDLD